MRYLRLALMMGFTVALLLTSVAVAQGPAPWDGQRPGPIPPTERGRPVVERDFQEKPMRAPLGTAAQTAIEPAQVTLGEPGLSFRYVDTFGVTEQPYFADAQHLNRPNGLFVDDGNLYVVEEHGARILKYRTSDGFGLSSIGTAGVHYVAEYAFSWPKDVSLDGSGNIWVVDNHRVTQYDTSGNFLQVFPDWDNRPWDCDDDNQHFCSPRGIAFDTSGRMYVSDWQNQRVQVFDFVGGTPVYSTTIGVTGVPGSDDNHFDEPAQVVIDSSDRLYVADTANHRVQVCTYDPPWSCGTFHGTGSQGDGPDELSQPYGLGIDGSDNIYIADGGNYRIKKCDTGGTCTVPASGIEWPTDVTVDSAGNLYVSHWIDCTIRKYNSAGDFLGVFAGTSGLPYLTDNSHFNAPTGVAVDPTGNIYLSTYRGRRVLKLDATGTPQWAIGTPGVWGSDNAHFGSWWAGAARVAVDSSGRVYVADTGNHRVQIYDSSGTYVTTLGAYGSGNYQFDAPGGVAVDTNGNIYVADTYNHRVQIYDSSRVYQDTIGAGVPGSDNAHFDRPYNVAVDGSGDVYVADSGNRRVQKCTLVGTAWACSRFAGVTGEWGYDFGHFSEPRDVAVDGEGRVYVVDAWNDRVQVFDRNGAYLTTIGGDWGADIGQFRSAGGVDVDAEGNVYIADLENHRIQKFAEGVPGWFQMNINGFGKADNWGAWSLGVFDNALYVGAGNLASGAEIYRESGSWEQVVSGGFGDSSNVGVDRFVEFDEDLYASTWNDDGSGGSNGGQIWRSSTGDSGSWVRVVNNGFNDPTNGEIMSLAPFDGYLCAGTWSYDTAAHGAEIWRSSSGDSGTWTRVVSDTLFGDSDNYAILSFEVFDSQLYAATANEGDSGGELWRTSDGLVWTPANSGGFGNADNIHVVSLDVFDGKLYAGTWNNETGGEIWRSGDGTTWEQVTSGGFGILDNRDIASLVSHDGDLHAIVGNFDTGPEVWRSSSGDAGTWHKVVDTGFGGAAAVGVVWDNMTAVVDGNLYVGTFTWSGNAGGKVWMRAKQVYVPLVMKNF